MQIFFKDNQIELGNFKCVYAHMAYGESPSLDFDENQLFIDSENVYNQIENMEEVEKDIQNLKCRFFIISDFYDDDGYAFPSVCFSEKDIGQDKSIVLNDNQIEKIIATINEMYNTLKSLKG